jgi:hypothetical protein
MNEKIQIPKDDIEDITQLTEEMTKYFLDKLKEHDCNIGKNVMLGTFASIIFNSFSPDNAWIFLEKLVEILQIMTKEIGEENEEEEAEKE